MADPTLQVNDQIDQGIRMLEEERRRIARDLHDGPAQALTNISMKLQIVGIMIDDNPEMAKSQINQLHQRVGEVVNEIRHLIYDLRPIAVDEVGLMQATTTLCRQLEKNWTLPIQVTVEPNLDSATIAPARQVSVYRLVQEILNNMHKHAQAKTIRVAFERNGDLLQITVQDDGVGFDPNYIPAGHYGLIGMRERAAYLGGQLHIDSVVGEGSTFILRVPVFTTDAARTER